MMSCLIRAVISILILAILYFLGLTADYEFRKQTAWALLFSMGIAALLQKFFKASMVFKLIVFGWALFFLSLTVRIGMRQFFGTRPNRGVAFETIANTSFREAGEFFISYYTTVLWLVALFSILITIIFFLERWLSQRQGTIPVKAKIRSVLKSVLFVFFSILFIALHFNPAMRQESLLYWYDAYVNYLTKKSSLKHYTSLILSDPKLTADTRYHGSTHKTVVVVLGESLTRRNMSLYGYERDTTPKLNAMRNDLVIFNNVVSGSHVTLPALQMALTPATITNPEHWQNQPNIMSMAKTAGYKIFWLSNQDKSDGWIAVLGKQADQAVFTNTGDIIGEGIPDEALFPHFDDAINDPAPLKLIFVHLQGSHFNYDMRYPHAYKQFDNINDTIRAGMRADGRADRTIQNRAEYDNSILYNDFVVSTLLQSFRAAVTPHKLPADFLYVSDHGQEVGHFSNVTRHSAIYPSGWEIPMIYWSNRPLAVPKSALQNRPYQTDILDSTLLHILQINTHYYHPEEDIFSPGFKPSKRFLNDREYLPDNPS